MITALIVLEVISIITMVVLVVRAPLLDENLQPVEATPEA